MRPHSTHQKSGVALLLTLTVILLLTIFMTEFFFETTLETRSIQNFKSSFTARTVAKSMFKAVLIGLRGKEDLFFDGLSEIENLMGKREGCTVFSPCTLLMPPGTIPDFEEATIYTPYVKPIDHLYNLNRFVDPTTIRPDNFGTSDYIMRYSPFANIIKSMQVTDQDPEGLYNALIDWMDKDDDPYNLDWNAEAPSYYNLNPEISIKQRPLDKLSEIRLIQGFDFIQSQEIWEKIEKRFTIYPVGRTYEGKRETKFSEQVKSHEPKLNINHVRTKEEFMAFLELFNPPESQARLEEESKLKRQKVLYE